MNHFAIFNSAKTIQEVVLNINSMISMPTQEEEKEKEKEEEEEKEGEESFSITTDGDSLGLSELLSGQNKTKPINSLKIITVQCHNEDQIKKLTFPSEITRLLECF